MTHSPSLADRVTRAISKLWRASGLQNTPLRNLADRVALFPIPFGLSSPFGTLYGWNMREKLHPQELETVAFFKKHIQPGDHVADIGANIGFYTLLFSSLVGNTGKVVSFEPSPRAYACLTRAVRHHANVHTENKGVFSRRDTLTLYAARPGDPMGSFMYKRGKPHAEVEVLPLREYGEQFNWAKIDVEGAQLEVLRGMEKPVRAVLEVARDIIKEQQGSLDTFFGDIERLGYRIYFIVDGGETISYSKETLKALQNNIYIEPIAT